jgi:hypothetical protein
MSRRHGKPRACLVGVAIAYVIIGASGFLAMAWEMAPSQIHSISGGSGLNKDPNDWSGIRTRTMSRTDKF